MLQPEKLSDVTQRKPELEFWLSSLLVSLLNKLNKEYIQKSLELISF